MEKPVFLAMAKAVFASYLDLLEASIEDGADIEIKNQSFTRQEPYREEHQQISIEFKALLLPPLIEIEPESPEAKTDEKSPELSASETMDLL